MANAIARGRCALPSLRTTARVLAGLAAAVGSMTAVSTWIGTKVLIDPATRRARRAPLKARFPQDDGPDGHPRDPFHGDVLLRGLEADTYGHWGLHADRAFLQIAPSTGTVTDADGDWVVRPFTLLDGLLPGPTFPRDRRRGESGADRDRQETDGERREHQLDGPWPVPAALTSYAWPDDPQVLARTHDADWRIDAVPSRDVHLPAWRFVPRPGDDRPDRRSTWLIGVHGRGSRRSEVFRLVHTALEAGTTALVVSYRTDVWTRDPARLSTLGHTEWEDVEAAVRLALAEGATRVVLAGCSLGGAICATFMRRSPLGDGVAGVILDSPALAWGPILDHVAAVRRIPRAMVPAVMQVAKLRAKLDWDALDHLDGAEEFTHPILLLHGSEDTVVPVALSDTFAAARPDLITYVRIDGAGHVAGWNVARQRYERAVARFLAQVSGASATVARSEQRRPSGFRRAQRKVEDARRLVSS